MVYKKGSDNRVADVLSRKPSHDSYCAVVSTCVPQWIQEVLDSYQHDPSSLSMISKLALDHAVVPHFTLVDGLLRYKSRVWIGANKEFQTKPIKACHASAIGGHFGAPVTYMRMKKMFSWTGMKTSCLPEG